MISTETTQKLTAFQKVNDWYSKHNFGTRFSMFVFLGVYMYTVGNNLDKNIIETTGYFALSMAALITLGDNALTKIGDIIVKVKGGKKDLS